MELCSDIHYTTSAYLAVYDVKVLIAEILEDFIDVLFFIKQCQRMQQITPVCHPQSC